MADSPLKKSADEAHALIAQHLDLPEETFARHSSSKQNMFVVEQGEWENHLVAKIMHEKKLSYEEALEMAQGAPAYVGPSGRMGFINEGLEDTYDESLFQKFAAERDVSGARVRSDDEAMDLAAEKYRREVIAHEMIHRLCGSPEMRYDANFINLNEALTQHLARQLPEIGEHAVGYTNLKAFSDALVDLVGEQAVRDAYFKGRLVELAVMVNKGQGRDGTFVYALELLNNNQFNSAAEAIKMGQDGHKLRKRVVGRRSKK